MSNTSGRLDGDLPEEYQSFIQVMSQKGIFRDSEFKAAITRIIGHPNFSEVIKVINKSLAEIELVVEQSKCEITGIKYWIFASTTVDDDDDDQTEIEPNLDDDSDEEGRCVWFSKAKLELLRMITRIIITSDNNCISKNDCINLVSSMKTNFSRGSADKFLKQMIHGCWLSSLDGYVYLGVRGIVELMPYLKSENPNLKNCHLCKQIVIYGQQCQSCDKKMHMYCLANYFKISGKQQCPDCSKDLHVNNQLMARYYNSNDDNEDPSGHADNNNRAEESTPGPSTGRHHRRRRIDDN